MNGTIPLKKTRFLFCIFAYFRLEFLGDALLDLLVIRHTFLNYDRNVTPGTIANYLFSYQPMKID